MPLLSFKNLACRRFAALLVPYNERTLPGPERSLVAVHLRVCDSCRNEAANLALMSDLLRANPPAAPSTNLWTAIEAQIRATPQESPSPIALPAYPTRRGWKLSASHAGLVAATVVLGVVLFRHNPTPVALTTPAAPSPNRVALLPKNQAPFVLKTTAASLAPISISRPAAVSNSKSSPLRNSVSAVQIAALTRERRLAVLPRPSAKKPPVSRAQMVKTVVATLSAADVNADWVRYAEVRQETKPLEKTVDSVVNEAIEITSAPAIERTVPATEAVVPTVGETSERQRALFAYSGG